MILHQLLLILLHPRCWPATLKLASLRLNPDRSPTCIPERKIIYATSSAVAGLQACLHYESRHLYLGAIVCSLDAKLMLTQIPHGLQSAILPMWRSTKLSRTA